MPEDEEMGVMWAIVNIIDDDSFVLILETNIMRTKGPLQINGEYKCYYNGVEYTGIIIDRGDDHAALALKMKQLNSKRRKAKKDDSFHEGRPRKAAEKCKSAISSSTNSKKAKKNEPEQRDKPASKVLDDGTELGSKTDDTLDKNSHEPFQPAQSSTPKHGPLGTKKTSSSNELLSKAIPPKKLKESSNLKETSDTDDSSSVSMESEGQAGNDHVITVDDFRRLQELSKKYKKMDFQSLMTLAAKEKVKESKVLMGHANKSLLKKDVDGVKLTSTGNSPVINQGEESKKQKESSASSSDSSSESDTEDFTSIHKKGTLDDSDDEKPQFDGHMFQWTALDEKVEELMEESGVYIKSQDLKAVKSSGTSGTAVARMLVRKIFTLEAQLACSVGGKDPCGRGKENADARPALDREGVEAIVAFSQKRAAKKKWRDVSEAQCHAAMGSYLCETRSKVRKNERKAEALKEFKLKRMLKKQLKAKKRVKLVKKAKERDEEEEEGSLTVNN